ncbi:PLP-dependent aminotransferase family protein [Marinomonas agarivorans]|nr:PLP-dependent aminotransferase family protein [Marinomonas agarivorans]
MTLYETLAQDYIHRIQIGELPSGSRLPALRVLAKQHAVSMTTANKTYAYLEATGWIFAQPQSGFFVSQQAVETETPTMPTFKAAKRDPKSHTPTAGYNSKVDFFCPLGTAMLAPSLQPKTQLKRAIKRSTARLSDKMFFYPNIQGEQTLRRALAAHFYKEHFAFQAEELTITHGCIDAVRLALETTTKVGDTIAISSPCFNGLLDLLVSLSRNVVEITSTKDGLDLDKLEQEMKAQRIQACLFNSTHMNPSGVSLSIEQKRRLAELAAAYRIPIIEDDVYFELSHYGKPPLPIKHWDHSGYVIWCGSFSKSLAEGARVGWCLPGYYFNAYLQRQKLENYGVNYLMQTSLAEFVYSGEYRTHINKTRLNLSHQIQQYRQLLKDHLPDGVRISRPEGGLVLWVQLPQLRGDWLEQKAKAEAIDIRSGANFSTHSFYQDCFRINCGWPLDEIDQYNAISARTQLLRLCELVTQYFSPQKVFLEEPKIQ